MIGFASFSHFPEESVAYIRGVAFPPDSQKGNLAYRLLQASLKGTSYTRLGFTTQNPRMFCLGRKLAHGLIPNPKQRIVPEDLQKIGVKLLASKKCKLELETFRLPNFYDPCMYESLPASGDEDVNEWFHQSLEVVNGKTTHGFLFIGNLSVPLN